MTETPKTNSGRVFTVSSEIFDVPDLSIYGQMVGIVLQSYANEPVLPSVADIAQRGRMSHRQVKESLQILVEKKLLPHRIFREILGDFGDDRLSWAAKGLLVFLKNNPQADFDELVELAGQAKDNEHSVRTALEELRRFGYLDELMDVRADVPG